VVVRVAKGDPVGLATALDAGASAIVMPHTETAEDVREMIKEVYYREFSSISLTDNKLTPDSPAGPALLQPVDLHPRHLKPVHLRRRRLEHEELQQPRVPHPSD
jgi:hypothetical protein